MIPGKMVPLGRRSTSSGGYWTFVFYLPFDWRTRVKNKSVVSEDALLITPPISADFDTITGLPG